MTPSGARSGYFRPGFRAMIVAGAAAASMLVTTSSAQAFIFRSAKQTNLPNVSPGREGVVSMKVSEVLGLFPSKAKTMRWTAPQGTTIVDLPSCVGGFQKVITAQVATCTTYLGANNFDYAVFPFVNSVRVKVDGNAIRGLRGGFLSVEEFSGTSNLYGYFVTVV